MVLEQKAFQEVILNIDEIEFVCTNKKNTINRKRRYKRNGKYVYDKYVYNDTKTIIQRFNYSFDTTKLIGKTQVKGFGESVRIELDNEIWNVDVNLKVNGEIVVSFSEVMDLTSSVSLGVGGGFAHFGGEITLGF